MGIVGIIRNRFLNHSFNGDPITTVTPENDPRVSQEPNNIGNMKEHTESRIIPQIYNPGKLIANNFDPNSNNLSKLKDISVPEFRSEVKFLII